MIGKRAAELTEGAAVGRVLAELARIQDRDPDREADGTPPDVWRPETDAARARQQHQSLQRT